MNIISEYMDGFYEHELKYDTDIISEYIDEFYEHELKYDTELKQAANTQINRDTFENLKTAEDSDDFNKYISEAVKRMMRGKDTAIELYKKLVGFLNGKGIEVKVKFPPIPVDNTFERLMFIAKYFHDENAKINELEDKLWVSDRTIRNDLKRLSGVEDPIQICGRKFIIPDTERKNGSLHQASTAHPLFLTENLTQVIIMLKGLDKMSHDRKYREYAKNTSVHIWQQLSEYAKNRIKTVLGHLSPEDMKWIEQLDSKSADAFSTEKECSVKDVMLDCLKNGKSFCVEYREDNGETRLYRDCFYENGHLSAKCEDDIKKLIEKQVLRSAYTPAELC